MLRKGNYPIVVYKGPVNIGRIAYYHKLMGDVVAARLEYSKLLALINRICETYSKNHESLLSNINDLRRRIRFYTKGVPVTEPFDAIPNSQLYDAANTSQLYNLNEQLLKRMYRKLATKVHPDKGGTPELFNAVNLAYKRKDLTFLYDLFFKINVMNDIYWIQSEGIMYALQEIERPKVSLAVMKATPLYAIARLHLVGNVAKCNEGMLHYLKKQEYVLTLELNSILTGGCDGNSKESSTQGISEESAGKNSESEVS